MSSRQENFSRSPTNSEGNVDSTFNATESTRVTMFNDPRVQQQYHQHQHLFNPLRVSERQTDMVQRDQNTQENLPDRRRGKVPINEPLEEVGKKVLVADIVPRIRTFSGDFQGGYYGSSIDRYESLIQKKDLPCVRLDCGWLSSNVDVSAVHKAYWVTPISMPNIDDWVSAILRVSTKEYRTWRSIFPSQSSRRKDHSLYRKIKPIVRPPPSFEAAATNIQSIAAGVASSRRRGLSPCAASDSTKRRRVPNLTKPGAEGSSSRLSQLRRVERTMPEVVEVEDDIEEREDENYPTGEEEGQEDKSPACITDFKAGVSNPTSRQVAVDIPTGVDLLSDFSMAAQLFENLLGPEEKVRLEQHELENSITQLITSILQSHRVAIASQRKASDQTDKLMTYSGDVERMKSAMSVLQAEVSELRSRNAGIEAARTSLAQQLKEIQREQKVREEALSDLTTANNALQEKVAQLEADLALAGVVRHKNEMDKERLEATLNADRHGAKLDRNWVAVQTPVNTLHEIRDNENFQLSLAVAETEATANAARKDLERALSGNEEDDSSESEDDDDSEDDTFSLSF
ncbi:hypothetical protein HAX54_011555 [Datura stramonium]|uniref:Uncharacterized protein n=1 Tax=Datura stramonium TaxID=4076 RepID=A0ABS8TI96_DATST|nr:hypothetical protein [Datura stramonium]